MSLPFSEQSGGISNKSFLTHIFSNTEEDKAEILNVVQYAFMGIIPIVILNKLIQRFIPEADPEKSTLELLAEIFIQIIIMFCGIILVHRLITFFPTYSGFKYENLMLTNVILAILMIVLSIQTKLGLKVNIIVDQVMELWNGSSGDKKDSIKKGIRVNQNQARHQPSQADYLDNSAAQANIFPPAPVATTANRQDSSGYATSQNNMNEYAISQPMAANSLLGGSFGSSF